MTSTANILVCLKVWRVWSQVLCVWDLTEPKAGLSTSVLFRGTILEHPDWRQREGNKTRKTGRNEKMNWFCIDSHKVSPPVIWQIYPQLREISVEKLDLEATHQKRWSMMNIHPLKNLLPHTSGLPPCLYPLKAPRKSTPMSFWSIVWSLSKSENSEKAKVSRPVEDWPQAHSFRKGSSSEEGAESPGSGGEWGWENPVRMKRKDTHSHFWK